MAQTTIELSAKSRNSLLKHPSILQAAGRVAAANVLFPDDSERFGEVAGEVIDICKRELGICGNGPLADEVLNAVTTLAMA